MSVARHVALAWALTGLVAGALAFLHALSPIGALHAAVVACTVLGFVVVLVPTLRLRLIAWLEQAPERERETLQPSEDLLRAALIDPDAAQTLACLLEDLVTSASDRHPSPALAEAAHQLAIGRAQEERTPFDPSTLEQILDALEQSWTVS